MLDAQRRDDGSGNGATLLEVRDLVAAFPRQGSVVFAANHVSFDVRRGETVGLVGESGSGKSVTCRAILNLVAPPGMILGGQVVFDSQEMLQMSTRQLREVRGRDIGMIFQDPMTSLNPVYPIGKQISETLRRHRHLSRSEARTEGVSLLDRVGIPAASQRFNSYPHELSGGMRQRVMIAIAISCRPKLLIADEPTTALDVTMQAQILSLLLALQREEGMAIVLVSHDLGVIAETCNRVVVMYAGSVVERATTHDVFERPGHPYTRDLLKALPRLDGARAKLTPIRGQPPDLRELPEGCPFAARCDLARPACREVDMKLVEVSPGQWTACPYANEGTS